MAKCKGCGADILFIIIKSSGRKMPVDTYKTTVITVDGELVSGYVPHWINCPNAGSFIGGGRDK